MEMEWNSNLLHSFHWTVRFGLWTQPSQNKTTGRKIRVRETYTAASGIFTSPKRGCTRTCTH